MRVLHEILAADGSTLYVNVYNTAVALLLIATNRSLEDEHEAVIAVMQAQAGDGRLDALQPSTGADCRIPGEIGFAFTTELEWHAPERKVRRLVQ